MEELSKHGRIGDAAMKAVRDRLHAPALGAAPVTGPSGS
jgi:hypothetical protein